MYIIQAPTTYSLYSLCGGETDPSEGPKVELRCALWEGYSGPGGAEVCERYGGWLDIGVVILATSSSLTSQKQRALNS